MIRKIGFGGGCHWCTEGVFSVIKGIERIEQGWILSEPPYDSFSEAVIVHYNPFEIELSALISIHLYTHASTAEHSMRAKYRSAIYTFDAEDLSFAMNELKMRAPDFMDPIITNVLPFGAFKASPEKFKDYYQMNPEKPFCQTYINPKIQRLVQQYRRYLKTP